MEEKEESKRTRIPLGESPLESDLGRFAYLHRDVLVEVVILLGQLFNLLVFLLKLELKHGGHGCDSLLQILWMQWRATRREYLNDFLIG